MIGKSVRQKQLRQRQEQIRKLFLKKTIAPQYFCSYLAFAKVFPSPTIYEAYTSENLNIIQTHLRFHQYIFEQMAPYKWIPIIGIATVARLNAFSLVFPIIYTQLFDFYFSKYFIWRKRNQKLINIRNQFITKLSKYKNIQRRVTLFSRIQKELGISDDEVDQPINITFQKLMNDPLTKLANAISLEGIPQKYIKFGESTQYIFHTTQKFKQNTDILEESHVYLTPVFQLYMKIRNDFGQSIRQFFTSVKQFPLEFKKFKEDYQNHKQEYDRYLFINKEELLKYKQIKNEQIYSETKRTQNRIRRFLEIGRYHLTGQFYMNGFTFSDWTHLNRHYDLLEPYRFNSETNKADLFIFYSLIALPKVIQFILKRKVSM